MVTGDQLDGDDTFRDSARLDMAAPLHQADGSHGDAGTRKPARRPWRMELARWLLTLNPGRTQEEYTKAVSYFFEAPGAPQSLDEISADLLLAYRGALAMRAERVRTARADRHAARPTPENIVRLGGPPSEERLPGGEAQEPPKTHPQGRLAPATVNLRLTALRQFLRFAATREAFSDLSVERIHAALRRLPIERRRPYQILSEEEWPAFLAVARAPLAVEDAPASQSINTPPTPSPTAPHSPWGATRAQRERLADSDPPPPPNPHDETQDAHEPGVPHFYAAHDALQRASDAAHDALQRASDGRTGARTAQRDYALVALALTTGLRAIELSLLDVSDITRERRNGQVEWWLVLPDEKTKGQRGGRTLPLAPELVAALLDYLQSTGRSYASSKDRATPLFLALPNGPHARQDGEDEGEGEAYRRNDPRRLRAEQIRTVINRIETQWLARRARGDGEEAGADGRRISPHALRHSAAIALLKGSEATGRPPASVEHVRGWLGHFDIRTTQRYLDHLSSRDERRRFTISPGAQPTSAAQPTDPTTARNQEARAAQESTHDTRE